MRNRLARSLILLAVLLPCQGRADIFVCHDASGGLVTTDHLSADCLANGGRQLNSDGSVQRQILSPQQQAAQDATAAQLNRQAEQAQQLERERRALVTRFPDRASFDQAQQGDLQTPLALIATAQNHLAHLRQAALSLQKEAQFYPKGNYPPDLRNAFETNAQLVKQEQLLISEQQREVAQVRAQYAALLAQLDALWARQAPATQP
jgi:hypothetical protein